MASSVSDTRWYSQTSSTQTMRTWSEVLTSYQDVPAEFQAAFPEPAAAFPYTVYVPAERLAFFQKRNARLLCLYADRVVLLEAGRDRVNTVVYPFQEILYLEQGRILLYSWLTIAGSAGSATVTFNTVTLHHFEPIVEQIRQATTRAQVRPGRAEQDQQELNKFDYLGGLNYKFMNYGRGAIRAGDTVHQIVYQPDRCLKTFTLFHKTFFSQYATGHLTILTDQELILIKESKRTKGKREPLYGGVFTHIPLPQIKDLAFHTDAEKFRCTMEITLTDKIRLRSEFALDNPDVSALQAYLGSNQANVLGYFSESLRSAIRQKEDFSRV